MKTLMIATAVVAFSAAAASANPADRYAAAAIAAGDYATAEATLTAELKRDHDAPLALLNLAYVYRHTERALEARALYQRVLSRLDVPAARFGGAKAGPVSSHDIAVAVLRQKTQTAAR